jgi:hypothetical protein
VVQVQKGLQGLLDNSVGLPPLNVDHEANTTGLVLKLRVIKALFGRGARPLSLAAVALAVCSNRHFGEIYISTLNLTKFR